VLFLTLLFMTASVTAEVFFLKEDLKVSDGSTVSCSAPGRSG
jgi:hypothetical protein